MKAETKTTKAKGKAKRKRKSSYKRKLTKITQSANNYVSCSMMFVLLAAFILWLFFFGRYVWGHTLIRMPLWLFMTSAVIGVVVFLKNKAASLDLKSFLKGLAGYTFGGFLVALFFYDIFLIANYAFSFHHPIYERQARITDLNCQIKAKGGTDWDVYFEFLDNGEKAKVNDKYYFQRVFVGDTATLSLKDGLFYIPIVKNLEYRYKK